MSGEARVSRERMATLAHDVGKYLARVAHNVPPGGPFPRRAGAAPGARPLRAAERRSGIGALRGAGGGARRRAACTRRERSSRPSMRSRPACGRATKRPASRRASTLESRGAAARAGERGAGELGRERPMSARPKLLIVDDGDRYVELAHALLRDYDYATRCELPGPCWECPKRPGCALTHAHDAFEADEALARHRDVDVVLLDVAFERPDERLLPAKHVGEHRRRRLQGVEILAHLRRARGDLPVVLMTSEEELAFEDAAEALAVDELITLAGADAFDARALGLLVERILARRRASPEGGAYTWGSSPAMARIRREAAVLARTSLPILVLGETGTGKSALAERVIHPATRREGAFVAVDLSALPASLMAAELFGTARGAFSGAVDRRGRFEEAHGGTLFLDEIGNLPAEAQRMLLLALQDGTHHAARREHAARGGREGRGGDQRRPRSEGARGLLPRRPLRPPQPCRAFDRAAAARAAGRHPGAARGVRPQEARGRPGSGAARGLHGVGRGERSAAGGALDRHTGAGAGRALRALARIGSPSSRSTLGPATCASSSSSWPTRRSSRSPTRWARRSAAGRPATRARSPSRPSWCAIPCPRIGPRRRESPSAAGSRCGLEPRCATWRATSSGSSTSGSSARPTATSSGWPSACSRAPTLPRGARCGCASISSGLSARDSRRR